jgi:hypothetical protein
MRNAVIVVVTIIVMLAGFAFLSLSGLVHSADAFVDAVERNNIPVARAMCTNAFNRAVSDDTFSRMRNETGLDHVKAVRWGGRQFYNSSGSIAGVVVDNAGNSKSIRLQLTKENGEWHVNNVNVAR